MWPPAPSTGKARDPRSADEGQQRTLQEVDDEERGDHVHERVHPLRVTADHLDENVGEETDSDADGDGVGEGHEDDGQECGNAHLGIAPVDIDHLLDHQETDEHQHRRGGLGGHHVDDRGQEDGHQEGEAGDDGGQARAGALTDARRRLDVAGVRRHRPEAAGHRTQRIDEQDLGDVIGHAVLVQQLALGTDGDDGTHGVEEVG